MTSRIILLVAASLCAASAFVGPAAAQQEVPLRASYQGELLPEGTEIIVLSKEGRVQRDGRYQPEFFPTTAFPRSERNVLRRDRLGDSGRSNRSYAGTQSSARLYFIYALTPDSTLYWSYSAQRDSLKYDVVNTGVMSVAPVLISEVRDDVLDRYFRKRVTVVMKGEGVEADDDPIDDALRQDSLAAAPAATGPADASQPSQDTLAASSNAGRVAAATAAAPGTRYSVPETSSSDFSPFAFWSAVLVLLAAAAVPAYFARKYRTELKHVRREMLALRNRAAENDTAAELRTALEDAELRYRQLEDDYEILEARYAALQKESTTVH